MGLVREIDFGMEMDWGSRWVCGLEMGLGREMGLGAEVTQNTQNTILISKNCAKVPKTHHWQTEK